MGNCCMRSSSTVWAGDDWGSIGHNGPASDNDDKESLLGGGGGGVELRIKISKKQLRELLKKADEAGGACGLRAEKESVLESLIEKGVRVQVRRRAWRPKLQTIPELFVLRLV